MHPTDIIDTSPPPPRRRRRPLGWIAAAILLLFLATGTLLSYYVDALWFESLGYGQVFRSQMLTNQLDAQFAAHGGLLTRANVVQAMEASWKNIQGSGM